MATNIGLYYPFIEFQNDAWVKVAALYWDKLGRVALPGYKIRDSDTVQRLQGELGFIENIPPSEKEVQEVSATFSTLLDQDNERFIKLYKKPVWTDSKLPIPTIPSEKDLHPSKEDLEEYRKSQRWISQQFPSQQWPTPEQLARMWSNTVIADALVAQEQVKNTRPAYIFSPGRMTRKLRDKLINAGLARPSKQDASLLGMHPKLAYIYLAALAERVAESGFQPVTDGILEHLALNGYTLERIAQALFSREGKEALFPPALSFTEKEIVSQMATIAISSVMPKNIEHIPVEKIIEIRKKYSENLNVFRSYIGTFAKDLSEIKDFENRYRIAIHLNTEYQNNIKPQIDDLKSCLGSLGIDTVFGVMNVKVALPPLIATGGTYFGHLFDFAPWVVGSGALALSILPVIRDKGKAAKDKMRTSPVAYLLRVEENLKPITLTSWIALRTRRFFFQV